MTATRTRVAATPTPAMDIPDTAMRAAPPTSGGWSGRCWSSCCSWWSRWSAAWSRFAGPVGGCGPYGQRCGRAGVQPGRIAGGPAFGDAPHVLWISTPGNPGRPSSMGLPCSSAIWITVEAVQRFWAPVPVMAGTMLAIAIAGLAANIVAFLVLTAATRAI